MALAPGRPINPQVIVAKRRGPLNARHRRGQRGTNRSVRFLASDFPPRIQTRRKPKRDLNPNHLGCFAACQRRERFIWFSLVTSIWSPVYTRAASVEAMR
ncbi:hypothetical protein MRB53_035445 [Persea americana]|uniref:Uncharacterized protein n=1 Tax=Persea americana TaxID=3435 RepID=A0ACC2K4N1_PERAE|nr:hypothetical protein MRB53_035445 [Persea americana]